MAAKIIDGNVIAHKVRAEWRAKVDQLKGCGVEPVFHERVAGSTKPPSTPTERRPGTPAMPTVTLRPPPLPTALGIVAMPEHMFVIGSTSRMPYEAGAPENTLTSSPSRCGPATPPSARSPTTVKR